MGDLALSFAGGLFAGLVLAAAFWLFGSRRRMLAPPTGTPDPPTILSATCVNGVLTVDWKKGTTPDGLSPCGVYVAVYDDQPASIPSDPKTVQGVKRFEPGEALSFTPTPGPNGYPDWVVVWAEYCVDSSSLASSFTCPAPVPGPGPVPVPPPPPPLG